MLRDIHPDGRNKTDAESAEHIAVSKGMANEPGAVIELTKITPVNPGGAIQVAPDNSEYWPLFDLKKAELKEKAKAAGMKVGARTTSAEMIRFLMQRP